MSSSGYALQLVGIERRFRQGAEWLDVLCGVDLVVAPGETVALTGQSGAGKSTLLHVAGLLDTPDAGSVSIAGQPGSDASGVPARDKQRTIMRRDLVGFVYQFHHLLPELTAIENVQMPQLIAGRDWPAAQARATELLAKVGLGDRLRHKPHQLSGGERQRVAICRAVANSPRILLADEPTGNLDPATAAEVLQTLLVLVRDEGLAILAATHNSDIAKCMNRVVSLYNGRIVTGESGTGGMEAAGNE